MALITLPSKCYFESVDKLQLLRSSASMRSRYTGKRQISNFPFALWKLTGKLIPKDGMDAGEWRAFLLSLEGQANTFRLPIPGTDGGPLTGYPGSGVVAADASVRAKSIQTGGWVPGAYVMAKGDYFNIGDELKMAMAGVQADAGGQATISFEPFLRIARPAGTTVSPQNPFMYVAAAGDDSATWGLSHPVLHAITLDVVEAVEAEA